MRRRRTRRLISAPLRSSLFRRLFRSFPFRSRRHLARAGRVEIVPMLLRHRSTPEQVFRKARSRPFPSTRICPGRMPHQAVWSRQEARRHPNHSGKRPHQMRGRRQPRGSFPESGRIGARRKRRLQADPRMRTPKRLRGSFPRSKILTRKNRRLASHPQMRGRILHSTNHSRRDFPQMGDPRRYRTMKSLPRRSLALKCGLRPPKNQRAVV